MSEPKPVELSALRFSISSLIATSPLICLMVVGWFNMDKRQTLNEFMTNENTRIIRQLVDNITGQQRTTDRLVLVMEELQKQNSWGGSGKRQP